MSSTPETESTAAPKGRLLRAIETTFAQLWSWGPLYFLIAISPGLALWPVLHPRAWNYIVRNDLSIGQRYGVLNTIALSFAATTLVYVMVWLRRRRNEPELKFGATVVALNRYAFGVLALPLLTALSVPRIEVKHEIFTAFLIVAVTALAMVFYYRVLALPRLTPPEDPFTPGRHARIAQGIFWAATVGYAGLFCYYTILDHHNLGTTVYDLGIYENLLWQTAHGGFLDCSFIKGGNHTSAHFDPILWLFAQVYRVYQHAETLQVMQTLWLASGSLPLWKLALHRLKNEWMAAILVLAYFLYPALHGVNIFDFHSLALIIPLVMWAAYLLDTGGLRRYWVVFTLLLLSREDISIFNCFLGTYAILRGHVRTGLATIGISLLYLACVKLFIMADSSLLMSADKAYSYVYFYEEMIPHAKEGARGLLISLLTNPLYALKVLFKQEKLLFFFHLLAPLLALPFAAGRKVVLMIHGLLFIGLASRKNLFSLHFQYSSVLLPMLFAAVPDGLVRVADSARLRMLGLARNRLAWTLVLGILTSSLLVSWKQGAIFDNAAFVGGWGPLVKRPTQEMRDRYAKLQEMIARIGPEAAVSANDETGPHIANRRKAYHWPTVNDAEYLLLYVESQYFRQDDQERLESLLKRKKFRVIDEGFGLQLLERIDSKELDEEFRGEKRGQAPSRVGKNDAKQAKPRPAPRKAESAPASGERGEGHGGDRGAHPVTPPTTSPATQPTTGLATPPTSGAE